MIKGKDKNIRKYIELAAENACPKAAEQSKVTSNGCVCRHRRLLSLKNSTSENILPSLTDKSQRSQNGNITVL